MKVVDWTRYAAATGVRSNDTFGETLTTVLQNEVRYVQSNAQAWMQWWLMQNHLMSPVGDHWGPVP